MIRLRGVVTLATSMMVCLAAPAFGQGFTDFRQAAQDQYQGGQGQNPTSAGSQGQQGATAASTTPPPPGGTQPGDDEGPDTGANDAPGGEGAGPVAVSKPQAPGPVKGQLPFTGSDLTTLVLIALLLVALGALAAVAERAERRRRGRRAPA